MRSLDLCPPPPDERRRAAEGRSIAGSQWGRGFEVRLWPWRTRLGHTDHAITRHQGGQLLFAHVLRAGRAFGDHQIAHVSAAIVDAYLNVRLQLQTKFSQHPARVDDCPRAVSQALVPVRWQAK